MANQNPIQKARPSNFMSFVIDKSLKNKPLKLSTSVKLTDEDNWVYTELNEVVALGSAFNDKPTEPLKKLCIRKLAELDGKNITIRSTVVQVPNISISAEDSATQAPMVDYKLSFYAGDQFIEEHKLTNEDQPAYFYTKINISLQ